MFGFGSEADAQVGDCPSQRPYHFWNNTVSEAQYRQDTDFHDFKLEHAIFRKLSSTGWRPGVCVREPRSQTSGIDVQQWVMETDRIKARMRIRRKKLMRRELERRRDSYALAEPSNAIGRG